jgi:hypothetical protein
MNYIRDRELNYQLFKLQDLSFHSGEYEACSLLGYKKTNSYITGDITSPLQSPANKCYVRIEDFTAVTMKKAVFWNVTPCGSCKNRCIGGMYHLCHQGDKIRRARNVSS